MSTTTCFRFPFMSNMKKVKPNQYKVEKNNSAKAKMEITSGDHGLKIVLEEDANLELFVSTANSSSLALDCLLKGKGSSADITTCSRAEKSDSQHVKTNVLHLAPDTTSNVKSRGASWDKANLKLTGLARVEKTAPGSRSRVECKALLLGEKSTARTDPILEILNNDVECSHAASIREIDKKDIFYLQTRGLSEEESKNLIVEGFLGEE